MRPSPRRLQKSPLRLAIGAAICFGILVSPALPDWLVNLLCETFVQKLCKVDLSKPLLLPDNVTHVELGAGRATFCRSPDKNR